MEMKNERQGTGNNRRCVKKKTKGLKKPYAESLVRRL